MRAVRRARHRQSSTARRNKRQSILSPLRVFVPYVAVTGREGTVSLNAAKNLVETAISREILRYDQNGRHPVSGCLCAYWQRPPQSRRSRLRCPNTAPPHGTALPATYRKMDKDLRKMCLSLLRQEADNKLCTNDDR
jgi:hypothetical protein